MHWSPRRHWPAEILTVPRVFAPTSPYAGAPSSGGGGGGGGAGGVVTEALTGPGLEEASPYPPAAPRRRASPALGAYPRPPPWWGWPDRSPSPVLAHLDANRAPVDLRAAHAVDARPGLVRVREGDEPEPARAPRVAIGHHLDVHDLAEATERGAQAALVRVEAQVTHHEARHRA